LIIESICSPFTPDIGESNRLHFVKKQYKNDDGTRRSMQNFGGVKSTSNEFLVKNHFKRIPVYPSNLNYVFLHCSLAPLAAVLLSCRLVSV